MNFPLMPPPQKLAVKWNFLLQSRCTQEGQGRDQIVRLKKKKQGSAVSACSDPSSQDEVKDSGHMPICPMASLPH